MHIHILKFYLKRENSDHLSFILKEEGCMKSLSQLILLKIIHY